MRHRAVVPRDVQKRIDKIVGSSRERVKAAIAWLEGDPYMGKALAGKHKGRWTYCVGPFRIIYSIKHRELAVLVIDITNRKGAYRYA